MRYRRIVQALVKEIRSVRFERDEQQQYWESAEAFIKEIEAMLREDERKQ